MKVKNRKRTSEGSGRRLDQVKWTIEKASNGEFPISNKALAASIRSLGLKPLIDGRWYSTGQICEAVFGSFELEKIREMKANADKLELQNAKTRGEIVSTDSVLRIYENLAVNVRQIVKHSGLSEVEKHEVLKNIRDLKIEDLMGGTTDEISDV